MYLHTHTQKEWLKTATSEETRLFLSKGPAETDTVLVSPGIKTKYVPVIRGSRFTDLFDKKEDALKAAETTLANIRSGVKGLPPLNEAGPGIDGRNYEIFDNCRGNEIRITAILHLASILGSDELETSFFDLVDDFVEYLGSENNFHPSVKALIPAGLHEEGDGFECRAWLQEYWLNTGFFGFALMATTPVYAEPTAASWGYCRSQWFYAETYDQAFNLAVEWAKEHHTATDQEV